MSQHITYTLAVYVTMPLRDDADDPVDVDYPTLAEATARNFKRDIETAAFNCLKRMEQDCDCEVMSWTVEDD